MKDAVRYLLSRINPVRGITMPENTWKRVITALLLMPSIHTAAWYLMFIPAMAAVLQPETAANGNSNDIETVATFLKQPAALAVHWIISATVLLYFIPARTYKHYREQDSENEQAS